MNNEFQELVLSLPLTEEVFDKLATPENLAALRASTVLSKRQWFVLWEKDLPADQAAQMLENDLDREQIEAVLASERRGTVLLSLFRRPLLDKEQQERALDAAKGTTFVPLVMQTKYLDPALRIAAAERLVGIDRLEWIAVHQAKYDDDAVFEAIIDTVASKLPLRDMRNLNQTVGKLIASRPDLVHRLASQDPVPSQLQTALASSRLLIEEVDQMNLFADQKDSKFAALAFVANPVAYEAPVRSLADHEDAEVRAAVRKRLDRPVFERVTLPYDQVEDPAQLQRLLRRCLPGIYRPSGRPADLAALALNDRLDLVDAQKVFDVLITASLETVPALMLDTALAHLAKRLGVETPTPRLDGGFWDREDVSYRVYQPKVFAWILSPQDRPWIGVDFAALMKSHSDDLDKRIGARTLTNVVCEDPVRLHLWLVHALGLDPAHWEMMFNLSKKHLGSLETLTKSAKRLTR
jgi:hypothetical protein